MYMKRHFASFLFVIASAFFTAGCIQESVGPDAGSVRFSVAASYSAEPSVRTVYSGIETGGKERIDWVKGDKIRIYSPEAACLDKTTHYADYSVYQVTAGGEGKEAFSQAQIKPVAPNGLQWGTGKHNFYATYPSPATSGMEGQVTLGDGTAKITLPAVQSYSQETGSRTLLPDMNYAYMGACSQAEASSNVSLGFKPMFTAFRFVVDSGEDATMTLTDFELYSASTAMSGACTVTFTAADGSMSFGSFPTASDANRSVKLRFNGGTGLTVTKGSPVTFTVFALPQRYDDLAIRFTNSIGEEKVLKLQDAGGTGVAFEPGRKYTIRGLEVPGEWEYHIDNLQDVSVSFGGGSATASTTFKSWRQKTKNGVTQYKPVPFKIQYSADGTTWSDAAPVPTTPAWAGTKPWIADASSSSFAGSTSGETVSFKLQGQYNTGTDPHAVILRGRTPKVDFDLSKIDVSTGETIATSTANCYVVQAPGTYKFPLVYGNALRGGVANDGAYHHSTTGRANVLEYFKDHLDGDITQPYIGVQHSGKAMEARVLWSDSFGIVTDPVVTGTGQNAWMSFSVPTDRICQGNAVLALFVDDDGDATPETIAWSWHIWITDEDLTQQVEAANGYAFPLVNLGWCSGKKEEYNNRRYYVRAVQLAGTGKVSAPATVTQTDGTITTTGNSPFWQFGRKDPFQAGSGMKAAESSYEDVSASKIYYSDNPEEYLVRALPVSGSQSLTLGAAIQQPYAHFRSGTNWCSTNWVNLWNASLEEPYNGYNQSSTWGAPVTKTIYDPSPVGYKMPPMAAFADFNVSGNVTYIDAVAGEHNSGMLYKNALFFPAQGQRSGSYFSLQQAFTRGFYRSAVPYGDISSGGGYGLRMWFKSDNEEVNIDTSTNSRAFCQSVRPAKDP